MNIQVNHWRVEVIFKKNLWCIRCITDMVTIIESNWQEISFVLLVSFSDKHLLDIRFVFILVLLHSVDVTCTVFLYRVSLLSSMKVLTMHEYICKCSLRNMPHNFYTMQSNNKRYSIKILQYRTEKLNWKKRLRATSEALL